ncbi:hypothetical protein [Rothia santali]|uniref:hypothetical protein n=1 Tax=Rothia santali TaxID=2949643 RepID=UPI00359FA887
MGRDRDVVLVELPWHEDPRLGGEDDDAARTGTLDLGPAGPGSPAVHDLLDALGEAALAAAGASGGHRVDVLGYSFGARLAWELAALEPRLVRRLALGGLPAGDPLADLVAGGGLGARDELVAQSGIAAGDDLAAGGRFPSRGGPSLGASPPAGAAPAAVRGLLEASDLPRAGLVRFARTFGRDRFDPRPPPTQPVLLALGGADRVAAGARRWPASCPRAPGSSTCRGAPTWTP